MKYYSTDMMTTEVGTLNWVSVFEPKAMSEKDEKKFSVEIILDQKEAMAIVESISILKNLVEKEVYKGALPSKYNAHNPIKDGNKKIADYEEKLRIDMNRGDITRVDMESKIVKMKELYANKVVFTAKAKEDRKPRVVDANKQDILDPSEIYSGCEGRICLKAFHYEHPKGGSGIALQLLAVQKTGDGDRLDIVAPDINQMFPGSVSQSNNPLSSLEGMRV